MKIFFLNNDGGGFADQIDVAEGTTLGQLFEQRMPGSDPRNYLINSALKQGRIVDAFLALNSVLHTYNRHSPYVSLDDWSGVRCSDCDDLLDSDHQHSCESCGSTICEDCSGWCEGCEMNFCKNCLEEIEEPEFKYCCRNCRKSCDNCQRFFVSGDLKNGLCPTCLDEQHTQQQEISHAQPDPANPTPADPSREAGARAVETAPA